MLRGVVLSVAFAKAEELCGAHLNSAASFGLCKSELLFGFVALAVVKSIQPLTLAASQRLKLKVDPAMFDRSEAFWERQFPASGALCRQKTNVAF